MLKHLEDACNELKLFRFEFDTKIQYQQEAENIINQTLDDMENGILTLGRTIKSMSWELMEMKSSFLEIQKKFSTLSQDSILMVE